MKLSDFLKTKKVVFENGEVKIINNLIDGDIEFYNLNTDTLITIKENIIDKMNETYTQERCLYDIIPYVCNIERDIELDVFINMLKSPTVQFSYISESLIEITNNIFTLAKRTNDLIDKVENMKNTIPELFIKEETIEEKIERVTKEMNEEKDTKKKKVLLLQLAKLYEEVEKNE